MAVVGLWLIDRSYRKPDNEDDDHYAVQDRTNFVDPADEPGALHGDNPLKDEDQKESEVQMPCLEHIVWICDLAFSLQFSIRFAVSMSRAEAHHTLQA